MSVKSKPCRFRQRSTKGKTHGRKRKPSLSVESSRISVSEENLESVVEESEPKKVRCEENQEGNHDTAVDSTFMDGSEDIQCNQFNEKVR